MLQVRIHGRGGQGVVTAAEVLSVAGFLGGRHALAFPSFGSERMGAPVTAYCRIDTARIATYEPVDDPDVLVVADPTLLHVLDAIAGLVPGGLVLLNTSKKPSELGLAGSKWPVVSVPATEIGQRHTGRPLPNGVLLGALAGLCAEQALSWPGAGVVSLRAVELALEQRFAPEVAAGNIAAAREGFVAVQRHFSDDSADAAHA